MRALLLSAAFCAACYTVPQALVAQSASSLTIESVNSNPTGTPPQGATWSPDGHLLTFIAHGSLNSLASTQEGDIVAVEASSGKARVLVSAAQIGSLGTNTVGEKDQDHRSRYGMASFLWSDDSRHLLLDRGGKLWLWDLQAGHGMLVVDTRAGSGSDAKFSPDGATVSYLRDHNLYVHPVGGGEETALTRTPADEPSGALLNGELDWVYLEELEARTNYVWSPDSKAIAYLQMDEAKVPQYPIEDFLPTHATVDLQRYPQPGDANPGVRVGVVSATGGETRWLDVPLSAGNDYIPRFGWINEHTAYVEVLARDQKTLRLYLADVQTGQSHLLQAESDPKYLEDAYDVQFLPNGRLLKRSWRDGHMHLYLYTFDEAHPLTTESKLERQLTSGDYEVEDFHVGRLKGADESIFFTSTEGSPLETNLWTMHLDGLAKRELSPSNGSHASLISPDGRYFTDQASSLLTPPVDQLCTTESSRCHLLWQSGPALAAAGTRTQLVPYHAADGKTVIYGRLTEPDAASGANSVPIILNPYGGPLPNAGISDRWPGQSLAFDQLLAQHGFAVLHVDNRGSGGRGREFQQVDYRNFGLVQLSDQLAALDQALAGDPRLDPQRVGWWGWSWGGFFTLYAMTHTDRIKAGVAVAPGSTDLRNYDSIYAERYMGLPAENASAYQASNVNEVAGKLKGRILIVQGTGDDNVHMSSALQFIQGLITAGVPYDLQLFPRLTHSLSGTEARNELYHRILFQFETYLKPVNTSSKQ